MVIVNKKNKEITNDFELNSKFTKYTYDKLKIDCNFFNADFYLDSYNYFPITENNYTFKEIFFWGGKKKYDNFYSSNFFEEFTNLKKNFKTLKNISILGSSPGNNYYRNLITFFPRLFFFQGKKIKIAVHRNCSNKFRNFISSMCLKMNIEKQFVFLDDGFYSFKDSIIPQFFEVKKSIKILNNLKLDNQEKKEKIYISRQNTSFRNLINEADIIRILSLKGFKIMDLNNLDIFEQIKLFSNASVVIGPTGSGLTNIVFCNKKTKVIEISPKYLFDYEDIFKERYSSISNYLDLSYLRIEADPINLNFTNNKFKKYISPNVLEKSNYYKNLLLKVDKIDKASDF